MLIGNEYYAGVPHAQDDAAADIKSMINAVMQQLSQADRRNGEALRQMQERLEALGREARLTRTHVPNEYLPGFDRIEDGMSLLANRIAQSYSARATVADVQAQPAPSPAYVPQASMAEVANVQAVQPSPAAAAPAANHDPIVAPDDEPNALRSSQPVPRRPRNASYGADVDTFDVIESLPGDPTEPWLPSHAAALSDLYTSRDVLQTLPVPQPVAASALDAAESEPAAAPVQTLAGSDRTWLDARLSDIATRIERSLANARPDAALQSMEHRLGEFEQRVTATLGGVASKIDVENLAHIEAQIHALRAQFEHANAELMRLDDLERQLSHIAQQTSTEHLVSVFDRAGSAPAYDAAAAPRAEADFHAVAIAAAEAAAARVAKAQRDGRGPDVHALLSDFIAERRHGEEQTANTLDTLQQAMLRMLDRVEAMEASPAVYAPHHDHAAAELDAHHGEEYPAHLDEAVDHQPYPHQPEPELVPEPAAAVPAGDYLAQQRAKMQASVQRAATAQRDKLKAQQDAAPAAAAAKGSKSAKPAATAAKTGIRRLWVSGLAFFAIAGAAGTLVLSWPHDANVVASVAGPGQTATPVVAGRLSQPKPLGASGIDPAAPTATETQWQIEANARPAASDRFQPQPASSNPAGPQITPETVTDDLSPTEPIPEPNQVRENLARSQMTTPAPLSGILLQKTVPAEPAIPVARATRPAAQSIDTPFTTQISARPTDLETATGTQVGAAPGQPRSALELPPATVGPLSLRLAAAQGDRSAQFEVASRLAEGKGTDQNLTEAVRWYQRSATQGFAQAQYRLGTFYERGLGVKGDIARARSWYQRAADQGNVKAMHNLAVLAAGRAAESPDYVSAARWFTQAASYGLADSQFNLAVLTESGLGVEKDMVQAAMWFTIAARSGDKEAIRRRDLMKSKMDPADLGAADHLVKTWQPLVSDKLVNDPRAAGEDWKTRQASVPDNG